jgi:hypothetical protein
VSLACQNRLQYVVSRLSNITSAAVMTQLRECSCHGCVWYQNRSRKAPHNLPHSAVRCCNGVGLSLCACCKSENYQCKAMHCTAGCWHGYSRISTIPCQSELVKQVLLLLRLFHSSAKARSLLVQTHKSARSLPVQCSCALTPAGQTLPSLSFHDLLSHPAAGYKNVK